MYIVITRSFPPEVGGIQNLMWGLTKSLSKHFMIKVFADYHEQHQKYILVTTVYFPNKGFLLINVPIYILCNY